MKKLEEKVCQNLNLDLDFPSKILDKIFILKTLICDLFQMQETDP